MRSRLATAGIGMCFAAALLSQSVVLAQAIPVGLEFVVNSYTTQVQDTPDVAVDADGDFVVVWQSNLQDSTIGFGIFGQGFDGTGAALGGEFQVNSYTTQSQSVAQVASEDNGDFVVTWTSLFQDGSSNGIFAQRFDSAGTALGGEFQVNISTASNQNNSQVAMDADGDFIVVWQSFAQDGSAGGVFGRRFDSAGGPVGGEIQINTYTTGNQGNPSVAMDPGGDFVVVWSSAQDGSSSGLIGQLFDNAGVPLGGEIQINTYTTGSQSEPSVAMDRDGDFVVTWSSDRPAPLPFFVARDVFGQRFSSTGALLGGEFQVNTTSDYNQLNSDVAMEPNGQFVVVWQGEVPGPFPFFFFRDVYAQQFSSSGDPIGGELQVNTNAYFQDSPAVGVDNVGNFIVTWVDSGFFGQPGADGSSSAIVARLYELPPRVLKREAAEALAEVLPTGDSETDDRLEEAIERIEASLSDELWLDDQHLSVDGEDVFREEKKAARELLAIVSLDDGDSDSDSDSGSLMPDVVDAVVLALGNLAVADERLTSTALDEATAAADSAGCPPDSDNGGDSDSDSDSDSESGCDCSEARREIAKGEEELVKAASDVADGRIDKAIDHYRKAWERTQRALAALVTCPI